MMMSRVQNAWEWIVWITVAVSLLLTSCAYGQMRVLCYYANWSESRNESFRLYPWNIDTNICTHVVYAFAMPDLSEGIVPLDFLGTLKDDDTNAFVALKRRRPDLTLMLSIGGWDEGSRAFSLIAADPAAVKWITEILCQKIRNVGFDGLDVNWQWPVPGLREGSNSADKENYAKFIKVIKDYFTLEAKTTNRKPLLLSVVLPPFKTYADKGFDLDTIIKNTDFLNIHSMDYHLSTAADVNHLAPLYMPNPSAQRAPVESDNVDSTVSMYIQDGINPATLNLGIPFFGYSYQLEDPKLTSPGSPVDVEGPPGFGTNQPGLLGYFEICKYVNDEKWTVKYPNRTAVGPYAYLRDKWVAYDDVDMIRKKVHYAMEKRLGGITLWTIDMDDFNGICRERFPLTRAVMEAVQNPRIQTERPVTFTVPNVVTDTPRVTPTTTTARPPQRQPPVQRRPPQQRPSLQPPPPPVSESTSTTSTPPVILIANEEPSATQSDPIRVELPVFLPSDVGPARDNSNEVNGLPGFTVYKTPGKFTYRSTKMQFNKNYYYLRH